MQWLGLIYDNCMLQGASVTAATTEASILLSEVDAVT